MPSTTEATPANSQSVSPTRSPKRKRTTPPSGDSAAQSPSQYNSANEEPIPLSQPVSRTDSPRGRYSRSRTNSGSRSRSHSRQRADSANGSYYSRRHSTSRSRSRTRSRSTSQAPLKPRTRTPSPASSDDARSVTSNDIRNAEAELLAAETAESRPRPFQSYKLRATLKGHKGGVAAARFSPDGKWIASCGADASVRIWEVESGKCVHVLMGHLAGISTVSWAPEGGLLASGGDDKVIRFWNATTGEPYPVPLVGHHNYVYSIAFSPKGNMLVSGSYDEAVFLWDVRGARVMRSLPAHSDPVAGVDFVRDGTMVASCSSDGLIRIWDTATGQCLRTIVHEDNAGVTAVRFSPNGKYILAWTLDSSIRLWDYISGRCLKTYQGHTNIKYSLTGDFGMYSDDTQTFAVSGSEDGSIWLWDVSSKTVLQKIENAHEGPVLGVDARGGLLVSCGLDGCVKIWAVEGRETTEAQADGDKMEM